MESMERTCAFHGAQSLEKHKKANIKNFFDEEFVSFAYANKEFKIMDECGVNCRKF